MAPVDISQSRLIYRLLAYYYNYFINVFIIIIIIIVIIFIMNILYYAPLVITCIVIQMTAYILHVHERTSTSNLQQK